jgi:hypothetical protein
MVVGLLEVQIEDNKFWSDDLPSIVKLRWNSSNIVLG